MGEVSGSGGAAGTIRFYDLFSGIGGFHLGLQMADQALFRCVGACDIDGRTSRVYRARFGIDSAGDATRVDAAALPDFDLLCGGFPCQPFSTAGRRRGFRDERSGNLFAAGIARIAEAKRPRYLLLENVAGLLSSDRGRTFARILLTLDELGYDVGWQCINAKHFVPQSRERVLIAGCLRGSGARPVLPVGKIAGGAPLEEGAAPDEERAEGQAAVGSEDDREEDPARRRGGVVMIESAHSYIDGSGSMHRPHIRDEAPTLTAQGASRLVVFAGGRARKLTPVECERIMGFPDGWTDAGLSDGARYHALGNAVVPQVIAFVGARLAAAHRLTMLRKKNM